MKLEVAFSQLPPSERHQLSGNNNKHYKCVSMANTLIHRYPMGNQKSIDHQQPIKNHQNFDRPIKSRDQITVSRKHEDEIYNSFIKNQDQIVSTPLPRYHSFGVTKAVTDKKFKSSFKFWPKRSKYVCFVEQKSTTMHPVFGDSNYQLSGNFGNPDSVLPDWFLERFGDSDFTVSDCNSEQSENPDFKQCILEKPILCEKGFVEEDEALVDLNNNELESVPFLPDNFPDSYNGESELKGIILNL